MHIDWFVFAAQIINFLILVALLKYFLYDRIVKAMDARQAGIASRMEEAERLRQEAGRHLQEMEEKKRQLDARVQEILNQAVRDAGAEKERLLALANEEAQESRRRWKETLAREREAFYVRLRLTSGEIIFSTIRRILGDMADAALEEHVVDTFVGRIRGMDEQAQELLRRSLDDSRSEVTLVSAFELRPDQQEKILSALGPFLSHDVTLRCEVRPELISGIELVSQGYRLAWSVQRHLETLEEAFKEALREELPEVNLENAGGEDAPAQEGSRQPHQSG